MDSRLAALVTAIIFAAALPALPFVDPLTAAGRAVAVSMDVRTKAEVKNDVDIDAAANKRLLDNKQAEWKGVTLLIFQQHVVLAGAVKTRDAKALVEKIVRQDRRIRSLTNDLVVIEKPGDEGSFARDKTIDVKIDATLTAAKGVSSVNMRWKTVNGTVFLMGVAQSKPETELAVSKIRELSGVKAVRSRLRVVPKK